jgi:hypothetical protein
MAGPGTVDDVLRVIAGQAEQPKYIRAYHGSPHSFDKFDASKIGTGEGAQAYGHGLYFAGNEEVADVYRKALSGPYSQALAPMEDIPKFFAPGNVVPGYGGRDKVLRFFPGPENEPWNWAVEVVSVDGAGVPKPYERPRIHKTHPAMRDADAFFGREPTRPGHGYEVELGVPEVALLDWDAPLRSQPVVTQRIPDYANAMDSDATGYHLYDWMKLWHGGPKNASEALLKEHGIPGIRYLDGNSRAAGQGTSNYVMFPGTEDQIRILRKYGLMAPVAAGAAQERR